MCILLCVFECMYVQACICVCVCRCVCVFPQSTPLVYLNEKKKASYLELMKKYTKSNTQIINITVIALKSSDNILGFSPKNDRKEKKVT